MADSGVAGETAAGATGDESAAADEAAAGVVRCEVQAVTSNAGTTRAAQHRKRRRPAGTAGAPDVLRCRMVPPPLRTAQSPGTWVENATVSGGASVFRQSKRLTAWLA